MNDPAALRYAADCYDRKAESLMFLEGRIFEAQAAIDTAISLRLKANHIEQQHNNSNELGDTP